MFKSDEFTKKPYKSDILEEKDLGKGEIRPWGGDPHLYQEPFPRGMALFGLPRGKAFFAVAV